MGQAVKIDLYSTPDPDDSLLSRKQRRAKQNKGEGEKRDIMRRWYVALNKYATERNDYAVKKNLEEFVPFIRLENPQSQGIGPAYIKLVNYGHAVECDIYNYVKETTSEERSQRLC